MSKFPLGKPLNLQVFSESILDYVGSIQEIILFDNETLFSLCCQKSHFEDDLDHSFVLIKEDKTLFMNCFNKEGLTPFTGSAAFALAHLYFQNNGPSEVIINSNDTNYKAYNRNNAIWLETDRKSPSVSKEEYDSLKNIYCDLPSGNYFSEFDSKEEIEQFNWGSGEILSLPFDNICSLTIFYWDQLNSEGYLRSFSPWYGRKEDQVTASITRYLASIIFEKLGIEKQKWTQLSKNRGQIHVEIKGESTFFSGNASLLTKD